MNIIFKHREINDAHHINVRQKNEVIYWANRFNVSEQELLEAVKKIGNAVEEVKLFLRK